MVFPICSPHHLSSNGVLVRTMSTKSDLEHHSENRIKIRVGEMYTFFYTKLDWLSLGVTNVQL